MNNPNPPTKPRRKKLIEVALPLEAINVASAREKSIRHGHPSTLHLWWARRPLAACRAVLFASLVDDPSSWPEVFPTLVAQDAERQRLFRVIEEMVIWENSSKAEVIHRVRLEIARSLERNGAPALSKEPSAAELLKYLQKYGPPVHDPFSGGGSIPLEAQRLGLRASGSDLNPVAVLIGKALIEIPPKFAGLAPINPEAKELGTGSWKGAQGLASDVRYYGKWMRDEAQKRIGSLYPKVKLSKAQGGGEATVIAWLWARTVKCSNPACGAIMPLARSFVLSKKEGKETWVVPVVNEKRDGVQFEIKTGKGKVPEGTVNRKGAKCVICESAVALEHVRAEGRAGRMGAQMMAIVAEGNRTRIYLPPNEEHEKIAASAKPEWGPELEFAKNSRHLTPWIYGMNSFSSLFTQRQLSALGVLCVLVAETSNKVESDFSSRFPTSNGPNYSKAIATYLAVAIGKLADNASSLCTWHNGGQHQKITHTFARQALSTSWDFAEGNPFSASSGNFFRQVEIAAQVLQSLDFDDIPLGQLRQCSAIELAFPAATCVSTDPPYYDNVPYADLSDFFYVFLRKALVDFHPELFKTLLVPKSEELIADPFRHGGKDQARDYFEQGLRKVFGVIRANHLQDFPFTVYYAFKQAETTDEDDDVGAEGGSTSSTGWETMLEGLIQSGFLIDGTWPMRTELGNRMRSLDSNALASSIVLVCRPREATAEVADRRDFLRALKRELPDALRALQLSNIAPVDLAQAAIGPGMGIYSRYAKVIESDGSTLSVRTALGIINQVLDEVLAEQDGEFDAGTRWVLTWFEQHGYDEGPYGDAETLSKARNTSVDTLADAGILVSRAKKVRVRKREELPVKWTASKATVWETAQYLIRAHEKEGEAGASALLGTLGDRAAYVRDLAYRLYVMCERKKWSAEGQAYNGLVIAWPEIERLARTPAAKPAQGSLL